MGFALWLGARNRDDSRPSASRRVALAPTRADGGHRDDAYYIAAVRVGDELGFTALVEAHLPALTRFVFGYLGDIDAAHDVVQEVFTRVWTLGADWDPKSGVTAYLFSAVRNRAYNRLQADHAREGRAQRWSAEVISQQSTYDMLADAAGPTLIDIVKRHVAELTDRQRDALRLRYEQELTMPQLSAILGIDVRAAEKLVARGIATLRDRLAGKKGS